jgi:class 3 adenylate cyclase
MASFVSVSGAIEAALRIQRALAEAGAEQMHVGVRIGIAAGEPVTENGDLFGATVQLAARLTARAKPESILVSTGVRDLAHGKGFRFESAKAFRLKGFDGPVTAAEVIWRREDSALLASI